MQDSKVIGKYKKGAIFGFYAFRGISYIIENVDESFQTVSFKDFNNKLVTRSFEFMNERCFLR